MENVIKKCLRFALKPLRIAKIAYSDPNKFRYWLHENTGAKFRPKVLDFPPMLIVETSSYCNLSCIHCPRTEVAKKYDSFEGNMKFNLYKKIINEMSQYKYTTLRPFGRGEALINPDISRMIKYAKEKGIHKVWLNTNGTLLSVKKSKELLEAGIDRLEVSIDAATRETFKKIKGKDKYDLVVKNTIECCRLKKELNAKTEIVVSFVESSMNTLDKDTFIKFWKNYTDQVCIRPVHQHGALVSNQRISKEKKEKERLPCSILWERVEINYYGGLNYCEFDWENREKMGNVEKSSIKEIWNSKKYKQLRRLHIEKRFSEIPLCSICKTYNEAGGW
ncbi:GTP 3',8-cyclase [subsurface metagenome]